jgi:hypothetical protein
MNKRLFLPVILLFALVLAISSVSAYNVWDYGAYSNGPGHFSDSHYSSHKSSTSGYSWGPIKTKSTDYERSTVSRALPWGGSEKVTTTTKIVRDDPYSGYNNYGRYNTRYSRGYDNRYHKPYYDHNQYDNTAYRYRDSYDYYNYGPDTYWRDYYYKPRVNSQGFYNWRY